MRSRSFRYKLINEKDWCRLAVWHETCFFFYVTDMSQRRRIHVSAIFEVETMRFTWLDSKAPIPKSRRELITSLVAAAAPRHRERNIISAAGNNLSLSRHLITECPNSRGFRPLHLVLWKEILMKLKLMKRSLLRLVFISLLAGQAVT